MTLPDCLTRDPDGEIRLTGHRMGLYTLIRRYREGRSPEQIAEEFPSLPLSLIYAVLAFYFENREHVDGYVDAYAAELARQEAEHVPGPGEIKMRELLARVRKAVPAAKHLAIHEKGPLVAVVRSDRPEDGEFNAVDEIVRAKLRAK